MMTDDDDLRAERRRRTRSIFDPDGWADEVIASGEHPLRAWRHIRGWSEKRLALAAKTTEATISRIENGWQRPRWDLLSRLTKITRLSADIFLRARYQDDEDNSGIAPC